MLVLAVALFSAAQEPAPAWRDDWTAAEARIEGDAAADEIEAIVAAHEPRARAGDAQAAWIVFLGAERLLALAPDADETRRLAWTELLWRGRMGLAKPENALHVAVDLATRRLARGEDDAARIVLEETLARIPEGHANRPYLLHPLADLERRQLRWQAALERIDEAERVLAAPPARAPIGCALLLLRGQIALDMGLLERAAPLLDEALAAAKELRAAGTADPGALVSAWVARANLRQVTRRFADLVAEVETVLAEEGALLDERPAARADLLVRLGMARAELALDDPEEREPARVALEEALAEPGGRALARLSAEGLLAELALRDGDLPETRRRLDAADARLAGGDFAAGEHAFVAALAGRLALAERSADLADVEKRLAADVERLLADWKRQPVRAGGFGPLHFERARAPIAVAMALALRRAPDERGRAAALELLVRAQAAGSLARALDERETSFGEARELLVPAGGGVLVYFPSTDEGHVFALDRAEIVHAALPDRRRIAPRIQELAGLVQRLPSRADDDAERARRRERIESVAAELGRALLPPGIAARLEEWSAVTIVGADLLDELSFECLPLPSGTSLGRAVAVAYLPSLPAGVALERRARARAPAPPTHDLCLVTGASPSADALARYPHVTELRLDDGELGRLTRAFAPERTRLCVGPGATASALAAASADARVLHVFAHGVWDAERERSAGLALTPDAEHADGLFFAEDAERLAASRVVLLTACESGVEPVRRGDAGAASLAGAFLRAGADAVVGAVSVLARPAALALMESFQLELARGASPAEALRRARCALAEDPARDDPAYTDLVRVVGLGHAPVFEAAEGGGNTRAWSIAVGVVVLGLLVLGVRRAAR